MERCLRVWSHQHLAPLQFILVSACAQVCLPVKWLDLGYNLVKTHDGASAFLVVDHDEEEMIAARAPIGNVYAPGARPLADL